MYVRERLRVYATWLVGFLIGLAGFLIIILSAAKVHYLVYGWQWIPRLLAAILPYSTLAWIWPWLPSTLLSVQVILGIFLVLISVGFTSYAFYINSIIRDAERSTRVMSLMERQPRYRQSVEGITAGRDVTITQIANAAKLDAWTDSFWKGPLGALIIAVAAIIIGAVFTNFTGLNACIAFGGCERQTMNPQKPSAGFR
jgi:hypothetical protein